MQTNIAKRYSILCKVFCATLFLLFIGAAHSTSVKKSLVYDDTSTELVSDLDLEGNDDNNTFSYLGVVPSSYTVLHETSERCQPTSYFVHTQEAKSSGKLYILFHQLKLDIA